MDFFLSGIGGYPPAPVTENHPAQKPLAEMGGTPPLNGKKSAKYFLTGSLRKRILKRCTFAAKICDNVEVTFHAQPFAFSVH